MTRVLKRFPGKLLIVLAVLSFPPSRALADITEAVQSDATFDCTSPAGALAQDAHDALAETIRLKWNVGSTSTDVLESQVTLRLCLSRERRVERLFLMAGDGPNEKAVDALFQSARRAVMRAALDGGLPLPADKYNTWRVLDLVFDANGMRLR
jgi:hypothetical protein